MRLTKKQMNGLLANSNALVRGIGFLYLRIATDPRNLWNWFETYIEDPMPIKPSCANPETWDLSIFSIINTQVKLFSYSWSFCLIQNSWKFHQQSTHGTKILWNNASTNSRANSSSYARKGNCLFLDGNRAFFFFCILLWVEFSTKKYPSKDLETKWAFHRFIYRDYFFLLYVCDEPL